MSSTNRGYNRHATDYYVTPKKAIREFLAHWLSDCSEVGDRPDKIKWLDPCAGGDKEHEMSYPSLIQALFEPEVMDTLDVRGDSLADRKEDYLTADCKGYDVIITNPPFYLAKEIIEKALSDVNDGGYVVMLLRLNFFGSNSRFKFFQDYMPKYTYVHHRRFSFTDNGKTDSIEYMHAVWKKGENPDFTKLKVI